MKNDSDQEMISWNPMRGDGRGVYLSTAVLEARRKMSTLQLYLVYSSALSFCLSKWSGLPPTSIAMGPSVILCAGLHEGQEGGSQKDAWNFSPANPCPTGRHFLLWGRLKVSNPCHQNFPWPSSKWSLAVINLIISNSISRTLIESQMNF